MSSIDRRQYLYNQIVLADPTKATNDTFYGDIEALYESMVVSGKIPGVTDNYPSYQTKLIPFYSKLATRNTSRCLIYMLGDSITEGAYTSTFGVADLPAYLQSSLRSRYPVSGIAGGRGYIPASSFAPGTAALVTLAGGAGATRGYGLAHQYTILNGPGTTATVVLNGTSFDIIGYLNSAGGTGYYTIDGGAQVTFSTNNTQPRDNYVFAHVTLTAGNHTIVVGWSSGGNVILEGFWEYNQDESAGINVIRGGLSGSSTVDWLTSVSDTWRATGLFMAPSLVVIQLGINDALTTGAAISPTTFSQNIQTIISNIRTYATDPNLPFILSMMYTPLLPTVAPWQQYIQAAQSIAVNDSAITIINHNIRMPSPSANTYNTYNLDTLPHPNSSGYRLLADSFMRVLG